MVRFIGIGNTHAQQAAIARRSRAILVSRMVTRQPSLIERVTAWFAR
jgi:hypothetical protein